MQYSASALGNLIKLKSQAKNTLMPGGKLTKAYSSMCMAYGVAIADGFNNWMSTATINNVQVLGGTCGNLSAISDAKGIAPPGSIIGRIAGLGSKCSSKFPTTEMHSKTKPTKSYSESVGNGFQEVFNLFLDTNIINNIIVSGGMCTCTAAPGPIPGSLVGASGKLSSLDGNINGIKVTKGLLKSSMISKMSSDLLVNGKPTKALNDSIDAVCGALEEYHNTWMSATKISNILANGGVTILSGPVAGAIGMGGKFN